MTDSLTDSETQFPAPVSYFHVTCLSGVYCPARRDSKHALFRAHFYLLHVPVLLRFDSMVAKTEHGTWMCDVGNKISNNAVQHF